MSLYGVPFVKNCEGNGGNAYMTCQVWYVASRSKRPLVACHVLYIYAIFYIFMPSFIYWWDDLYIYVMFYTFMPCFIYYLCQFQYMLHHYWFMLHRDCRFYCIGFSHLFCINTNLRCMFHGHLIFISKERISWQTWLKACGAVFIPTCTCIHDHSAMTDNLLSLY